MPARRETRSGPISQEEKMPETATPAEAPEAPATATAPSEPAAAPEAPPWGEDFDPARAWKTIQAQREDAKSLKARLAEFEKAAKEREDAEKTEAQRLAERAERAEASAAEARQALAIAEAARKYGLSEESLAFLSGVAPEEIEARAEALAGLIGAKSAPTVPGKPKPNLTPGEKAEPAEGAFDPAAVAASILKRNDF